MSVYLGKNKIGITKYENLDTELTDQETKLADLEADVNALSDKPTDMLQQVVDANETCDGLFKDYKGTTLDISRLDTSNATSMQSMFQYCSALTSLDVSGFNTSNVTDMDSMFSNCKALTTINGIESFNTSSVIDMYQMFTACSKLTSLDLSEWDTSKVMYMGSMFAQCTALTSLDLSGFDTSNVTSMSNMFGGCSKLSSLDVSNFDTSKITSMEKMFYSMGSLESLNFHKADGTPIDTSNVTTMQQAFHYNGVTSLDLSNFNVSSLESMYQAFYRMSKVTTINLSGWDTSNLKVFSSTFGDCNELTTIMGKINLINTTSISAPFYSCEKLTDVTLLNIKKSIPMGGVDSVKKDYGHLLSNATLINTIQQLWDLTGSTSQTLWLNQASKENIANIYVKLVDVTDEMLAEDEYAGNKKPCVVCESTDEGAMTLTEYCISKNWAIA